MSNPFLLEFMNMRKNLNASSPSPAPTSNPKTKPKKDSGTKTISMEATKPGFKTIIDEKPGKRPVIEYLQKRANELTIRKMA